MKKHSIVLTTLLLLMMILNTGCWNRRELNDLSIVSAIGIDKKAGKYSVSAQVVIPGEVGKKASQIGFAPVTTYTATGETIFECFRKMTTVSPRKLYMSHVRILVIHDTVAREGIHNILDFFIRDPEFRPDFYVAIAKGSPALDVLGSFTQLEKIPANKLFSSLDTSEKAWAPTVAVHLDELITKLITPGTNPVLTGLVITGNKELAKKPANVQRIIAPARMKYTGIGVFQKDKLVGWLNLKESKGFNYIMGNVKSTVGPVYLDQNNKVTLEWIHTKSEIKGTRKAGKPAIEVVIHAIGNVGEVEGKIDLIKPNSIKKLETLSNERIKLFSQMAITKAQKQLHTDIFGFGTAIHRADPKAWKSIQKNWEKQFENLDVTITVDCTIRLSGKVNNSFIQEMNKK